MNDKQKIAQLKREANAIISATVAYQISLTDIEEVRGLFDTCVKSIEHLIEKTTCLQFYWEGDELRLDTGFYGIKCPLLGYRTDDGRLVIWTAEQKRYKVMYFEFVRHMFLGSVEHV